MRKFDEQDSLKKSTIVHQLNIDDEMETFVDIYMDDKFIVMIYEKFDSPDFYKIIQVRSTETLDIIQTIRDSDTILREMTNYSFSFAISYRYFRALPLKFSTFYQ